MTMVRIASDFMGAPCGNQLRSGFRLPPKRILHDFADDANLGDPGFRVRVVTASFVGRGSSGAAGGLKTRRALAAEAGATPRLVVQPCTMDVQEKGTAKRSR